MGKTNKDWHLRNRLPKNAAMQQRMEWHLRHVKACACRPIPASVLAGLNGLKKKT
jgi:hypothetical protein